MTTAREQLSVLYHRHAASVHRRALRILSNEADAREVLQDVFVSLLERPEQLDSREAWSSYLYAATTHACLNRLRNQRNRARLLEEEGVAELAAPLAADSWLRLRDALQRLPEELAVVAVYYFLDGMSQQEIADQLGCSRRHVGNMIAKVETWGRAQEARCLPE